MIILPSIRGVIAPPRVSAWSPKLLGGQYCWEDVQALGLSNGPRTTLPAQFAGFSAMTRATGSGTINLGAGSGLASQVLVFPGATRFEADLASNNTTEITLWAVCRYTSSRSNVMQLGNSTSTSPSGMISIAYDGQYETFIWGGGIVTDNFYSNNINVIHIGRWTASGSAMKQSVNGRWVSGTASPASWNMLGVGSGWGDMSFTGDVVAFGYVPTCISDADTQKMEGWSKWKYSTPLPSGHPYLGAPP